MMQLLNDANKSVPLSEDSIHIIEIMYKKTISLLESNNLVTKSEANPLKLFVQIKLPTK